ncbi:hypothetical protein [Hyphomonas jannaschiana]|uniref:DUF3800 domain-containing protein n=1 Tax=Hyphomonas jannaschiana VP2 TaxID=1280952 RepID=A0A059FD03_9PROT|nr:hypothetical protein [Hyphomonas jannaschiana]KCZ88426.1 hypothetical protein HJA_08664 [Hyphomonas jannaschiana VP2]
MHIFIDESGSFSGIDSETPSVSTLGALVLPSYCLPKLFRKYAKLREHLPKRNNEVKGSLLDESQFAQVIDLLRRNQALFCGSMIDLSNHTPDDIELHRTKGIAALERNLADGHTQELRENLKNLQERMASFSKPLYVQMMVTVDLLHRAMEEMIGFHCQRNPKELAGFHWMVDAKQKSITDWEDWWSNTLIVWLQAMSIRQPKSLNSDGNYQHFERFFIYETPGYLLNTVPPRLDGRPVGVDLQKVFGEHFDFSSDPLPGLELVDIVTNCLRRALIGNLQEAGWLPLRELMINGPDYSVRPVSMKFEDQIDSHSYSEVLHKLIPGARPLSP